MTTIICADDYACNASVSDAILDLLSTGKINATSCLVTGALWTEHGKKLKALLQLRPQSQIGLHINFTEGPPLTVSQGRLQRQLCFKGLPRFIIACYLRCMKYVCIEAEIKAQWDLFEQVMGRAPDFIDGHQHVQQLPIVRQALLAVYRQKIDVSSQSSPWVRVSSQKDDKHLAYQIRYKAWIIRCLGSKALVRLLRAQQVHFPTPFAGIYLLHQAPKKSLLPYFMRYLSGRGVLMCHPANYTHPTASMIEKNRMREYQLLKKGLDSLQVKHDE